MASENRRLRDLEDFVEEGLGEYESGAAAANYVAPVPPQRWVLLHYQIFKNAGTTIDYLLERTFGSTFASVEGPDPDSALHASDIALFVASHPGIGAISSHHLRYPKPVIPGVIVSDLCFFRDPLERLWLTYNYLRRVEPADEMGRFSRSLDARSFFAELIEKHPESVNDLQVNLLANRGEYTRPPTEADLCVALDILRQISIIGVVDLFDESALAAEYFARPAFPTFQFQYVDLSIDLLNGATLQQVKDEFRDVVGNSIYQQLERMNALDTELVACARKEVLRRWGMLPNREARVADFRDRCRILQAVHDAKTLPHAGMALAKSAGLGRAAFS